MHVNREQVAKGLAWRYVQYDKKGEFTQVEPAARAARKGVWGDANPVPHWEWRKGEKERRAAKKGVGDGVQQTGGESHFRWLVVPRCSAYAGRVFLRAFVSHWGRSRWAWRSPLRSQRIGSQLRPNIVWFDVSVPAMEETAELVGEADVLLVVGTSLVDYPAASLVFEARKEARRIVVNPEIPPGCDREIAAVHDEDRLRRRSLSGAVLVGVDH